MPLLLTGTLYDATVFVRERFNRKRLIRDRLYYIVLNKESFYNETFCLCVLPGVYLYILYKSWYIECV